MPKNYFLYNERIEYSIHLDCRILQIPVKKISVCFYRNNKLYRKKNNYKECLYFWDTKIISKDYPLDKIQKLFDIVDYFYYTDTPNKNLIIRYPINIYNKFKVMDYMK